MKVEKQDLQEKSIKKFQPRNDASHRFHKQTLKTIGVHHMFMKAERRLIR